jgi:hypothetical protein
MFAAAQNKTTANVLDDNTRGTHKLLLHPSLDQITEERSRAHNSKLPLLVKADITAGVDFDYLVGTL